MWVLLVLVLFFGLILVLPTWAGVNLGLFGGPWRPWVRVALIFFASVAAVRFVQEIASCIIARRASRQLTLEPLESESRWVRTENRWPDGNQAAIIRVALRAKNRDAAPAQLVRAEIKKPQLGARMFTDQREGWYTHLLGFRDEMRFIVFYGPDPAPKEVGPQRFVISVREGSGATHKVRIVMRPQAGDGVPTGSTQPTLSYRPFWSVGP